MPDRSEGQEDWVGDWGALPSMDTPGFSDCVPGTKTLEVLRRRCTIGERGKKTQLQRQFHLVIVNYLMSEHCRFPGVGGIA